MNQPKPYLLSLLITTSIIFLHSSLAPRAQAGGSEASHPAAMIDANSADLPTSDDHQTEPTDPVKVGVKDQRQPQIRPFDWRHWSQPSVQGDKVCREHEGNIVCLTRESAKRIGW